MFKNKGFRFLPNMVFPAFVAGELIPYYGLPTIKVNGLDFFKVNRIPLGSAFEKILQGGSLMDNVWSCFYKLTAIIEDFFNSVPLSGKIASKEALLALNITDVNFTIFR